MRARRNNAAGNLKPGHAMMCRVHRVQALALPQVHMIEAGRFDANQDLVLGGRGA